MQQFTLIQILTFHKNGNLYWQGMAFIPKLLRETSFRRFFFRPTHPGKKRHSVAETCRQSTTIKTLATNINKLL